MQLHPHSPDYKYLSQIDCNSIIEVDGDWLLSGARKAPAPNIRIVTASLPSNGDYTAYIIAGSHRGGEEGAVVILALFFALGKNSQTVQTQEVKAG